MRWITWHTTSVRHYLTVSLMGSLLVIGASWLRHRPLLAVALLGTSAGSYTRSHFSSTLAHCVG